MTFRQVRRKAEKLKQKPISLPPMDLLFIPAVSLQSPVPYFRATPC